jgi:hypothetical protein
MTRSRSLIGGLACLLLLAGCGGSASSSSSPSATASSSATATTSASATSSTAATSTAATTSRAATTTTSASPPPEVSGSHHKPKPKPLVTSGVSIPAAFLLRNGKLEPSSVAVPAGVTISLGVNNRDHARYSVVLVARGRHTLHLAPASGAVVLVPALPKGSYPVLVNGTKQATLTVGATGGP